MADSINKKPVQFSDYLGLVAEAREKLSLSATPEATRVAMEVVDAALDSGFLATADQGTAPITPDDTGLAPNKYLATGPMAPGQSNDPGLKAVDPALAEKTDVAYDDETQAALDAKKAKRK